MAAPAAGALPAALLLPLKRRPSSTSLVEAGANKVGVIKAVREITGLGLGKPGPGRRRRRTSRKALPRPTPKLLSRSWSKPAPRPSSVIRFGARLLRGPISGFRCSPYEGPRSNPATRSLRRSPTESRTLFEIHGRVASRLPLFLSFRDFPGLRTGERTPCVIMRGSFTCSLIRLQRTSLVGLQGKPEVVRQRLVVANHQASRAPVLGV